MTFFKAFVKGLLDEGHTIDIATNENASKVPDCYHEWGCTVHQIDTSRSPLNKGNLKAIKQLKKLVEQEKYDIVHCHTPVAAMCTRLACRKARKKGTMVFYTAHGFHFYKGAPLKNWMLYYPVEKICAHFTDVLITINQEDYGLAQKKMKAKRVEYVPGVGVNLSRFGEKSGAREAKRAEIRVEDGQPLLFSVGELNENKNHKTVLHALPSLPNVTYAVAGEGNKKDELLALAESLGVGDRFRLLGFRRDVKELYEAADVFVFPSFREGLSVSVMEAMASGLPVVASRIRGNTDLVTDGGGCHFDPYSTEDCLRALTEVLERDRAAMGAYNARRAADFGEAPVFARMREIYGL